MNEAQKATANYMYFLKFHTLAFMFTTLTYAKCMRTGHMVYC